MSSEMEHEQICQKCLQASEKIFKSTGFCQVCHKKQQKHDDYVKHKAKRQETQAKYYEKEENKQRKVQQDKRYFEEHKSHYHEQHKNYYQQNKEKIMARRRQFRTENKETISQKRRMKRASDINMVITEAIGRRMRTAIFKDDLGSGYWFRYLGCSLEQLKQWFEYLFPLIDPQMSFENYGKYWEIDHVKPISSFDLSIEEQRIACFSWTNVSPLTVSKNRSKHCKIVHDYIDEHKQRVNTYLSLIQSQIESNQIAQTTADLQ